MGDETYGATNVRYGVTNMCYAVMNEDGTYSELRELGDAVSFDIEPLDDDEARVWSDALVKAPAHGSFGVKVDWWQLNRFCTLVLGYAPPYRIGRLRRGGKSHKGKGFIKRRWKR